MEKTIILLLGFPRTGSKTLADFLHARSEEENISLGIFRPDVFISSRQHEVVKEILSLSDSKSYSEDLNSLLRAFMRSKAMWMIFNSEEAALEIRSANQLSLAEAKILKLIGAKLLLVFYVRSPMYRFPSWVLHKAAMNANPRVGSPANVEEKVRRTLGALHYSNCRYLLREFREDRFNVVEDFGTEVLKMSVPSSKDKRANRSLSPEFILGSIDYLNRNSKLGITVYDLARSFAPESEIVSSTPTLHHAVEISLVRETEKLNWWLRKMTNFCFDTAIKYEFELSNLSLRGLSLQDLFLVDEVQVRLVTDRLSSVRER